MGDLRLRVTGSYGEVDLVAQFDDHTSIGQLADGVEKLVDRPGDGPRTMQRKSRGDAIFSRGTKISQTDLRSGDKVCLALDTGLRAAGRASAAANLRVVGGPDAGRTFELQRGESSIGRSSSCDIVLSDDMASRKHALIRVSDIVEVADAGSTNGVLVNDAVINGVRHLRPGDRLLVGDTVLVVDLIGGTNDAVLATKNVVEFNRPPRIERPFAPLKITLPAPLDPLPKPRIPLIAAIVPLFMGGIMFAVTKNPLSVMFIAMSPLMLFGNFFEQKRSGKKDHQDRTAEFKATLADQVEALDQAKQDAINSRFRFSPGNNELLGFVDDLDQRLWERQPEDSDFLHLRVGLRERPSEITVEIGNGGKRDQRREMEEIASQYRLLPPVPITVDARRLAPVGVAGPKGSASDVARSLVLQAAALHSPNELAIGALLEESTAAEWDWLKWLPHCHQARSPVPRSLLSIGADDGIELLAALQELIRERTEDDSSFRSEEQAIFVPQVMVLIDGNLGIERSRFSRVLEAGQRAGISVVWLSDDRRKVPNACLSLLSVEPGGASVALAESVAGTELDQIPIEGIVTESAEVVARSLAPIVDISAAASGGAGIPKTVGLVDLLGGLEVLDDPTAVSERWTQAAQARTLRAPVGKYDGGTLSVDLRVDGPHGLVGGTTGAGKSEFLQSLITSLAASHGPDRINFLLVDYKGGTAFGELVDQFDDDGRRVWQGLHHTVGMITDLSPAMVQRALVSLQAELHRREVILSSNRFKDLVEMEKSQFPGTPPSLLIVIDEFAALAKEVPAFVDGVVDIAQRGRSLGLHLLLATQKPGGVVTANIQANTNLRVALRMASEDESTDVVNSPIAGRIDRSTPGRGVMRRGPSDLVAFQSAYVGGETTPASEATLELGEFGLDGVRWIEASQASSNIGSEGEIDLKRLVRVINAAASSQSMAPPRRPWLDPLPDHVNLLDLPRPTDDTAIPFGLSDIPKGQTRQLALFEPDSAGSLLMYGMGGSGKTVALRTLATSFGLAKNQAVVRVYGLDFAGRGLDALSPLPHVGSIVPGDDYERVTRLLKDITSEISSRADAFALARASNITEYRRSPRGDSNMARMVVLLDGYDNFTATYERIDRGQWAELMPRLVADGRQVGIHFVLTGTRRSSFPMALASQVSTRLVFRMASEDDYHSVNVDPKQFDKETPRGRCQFGDIEVQIAMVGESHSTENEGQTIRSLGASLASRVDSAPAVRVLPEEISLDQMPPADGVRWLLTEDFQALGPDFSQNVLIAGRPRSGKTTALQSLIIASKQAGLVPEVYAFDPKRFGCEARSFDDLNKRMETKQDGLIFIEEIERLAGSPCEFALQQALGDGSLIVVASADSAAAKAYDQTLRSLRARCDVLVLQPDPDADADLLSGPIPRTSRKFPPGRGYVNLRGSVFVAQVAVP